MAVVKGQAIRRREGQLPNTAVMAEHGSVDPPVPPDVACPVGRCKYTAHPMEAQDIDFHLLAKHSRHPEARAAATRLGW